MIELYKETVSNQYQAALRTVSRCIDQCPDEIWNELVGNLKFCQVAFHTLFFTDIYLGKNLAAAYEQSFHLENAEVFEGYEELEKGPPKAIYTRSFINDYLNHCREKASQVIAQETEESLSKRPGFDWHEVSRAELHFYNIRHIQHHAAQMSLRLRLDTGEGVDWVRSGWQT